MTKFPVQITSGRSDEDWDDFFLEDFGCPVLEGDFVHEGDACFVEEREELVGSPLLDH